MAVSGEVAPQAEPQAPAAPAPSLPEGAVVLDKKEHDRLQAELRRAQKAVSDREAADAQREADERAAAAKAAGDFDSALAAEREEKAALQRQLADRDKRDAVRDEIAKRQLTGSKAQLVTKLAALDAVTETDTGLLDASAAVQAVIDDYPDLLGAPAEPEPQPDPIRRNGPAPPAPKGQAPFEGYIAEEEYGRVPQEIRLTPEFQKRVALSRPYWSKTFLASDLPKAND